MEKRPANLLFVQAFEGATPPDESAPLTVKRVKILGLESRHGHKFTESCLRNAVTSGIYEGLTIYRDHPTVDYSDPNWRKKTLPPRSVDDVLGSVANIIYVEGEGIFGDAIFTKDCDLTRSVCMAAKTNPRQYGFSHHAAYSDPRFEGETQVYDEILTAFSVDLVTRPATTNGLFEGDPAVSKDKSKATDKRTPRTVLESVCTVGIARKVIQALEGDFMDAPMAPLATDVSSDDAIAAAFSAAVAAIAADTTKDLKTKIDQLKQVLTAQDKLAGGGGDNPTVGNEGAVPVGQAMPAKEGDDAPDKKDDKKVDEESAPPQPIGHMEALSLLETNKIPITKIALESYAMMPLPIAQASVAREVASQKEISDLKARLELATKQTPRSIPRINMEGGAGVSLKDSKEAEKAKEKPWLNFCRN